MAGENNPNWGQCPKCGSPVMIDPKTGILEPCSNCLSLASRYGGLLGAYWLLVLLAGGAALIYFCVRMFL